MYNKQCFKCQKLYNTKDHRSKFCSNLCSCAHNNEIMSLRASNKAIKFRFCATCKKSFSIRKEVYKYCSRSCAAITINSVRQLPNKRFLKNCLSCGSSCRSLFCNQECKTKNTIDNWLKNIEPGHTKYGTVRSPIRLYLLKEVNYKCSLCNFCGINPKTGSTILQIDHIDGNCLNGTRSNLRVLCPNCHAMTDNYGRLNKTSNRSWKRNAYKSNKISVEN